MARPKSIPRRVHHKPSGLDRVRVNGRDIYLGPHNSRQAKAAYRRVVNEYLMGLDFDDTPVDTVGQMVEQYWPEVLRTYRKHGRQTSEVDAQRVALRFLLIYADLAWREFGPRKLKAVRFAMIRDGLARRSINRHVGRIRQVFAWAAEDELIDPGHPKRLECVRNLHKGQGGRETPKKQPVEWEHVEAVAPYVPAAVWAMVQLQWSTGMRSGEIVQMQGRHIDMSGDVWYYSPPEHKTEHHDQDRIVAIGPIAQAVLKPWLRPDLAEHLFQPRESEQARNATRSIKRQFPRWPSHDPELRRRKRGRGGKRRRPGTAYNKDSYRRAIQRAVLKVAVATWESEHGEGAHLSTEFKGFLAAGKRLRKDIDAWCKGHGRDAQYIADFLVVLKARMWHPHQLRHAFGTRAREEFEELDPVQAAMGHSSAATTEDYARLNMRKAAKVARRIG